MQCRIILRNFTGANKQQLFCGVVCLGANKERGDSQPRPVSRCDGVAAAAVASSWTHFFQTVSCDHVLQHLLLCIYLPSRNQLMIGSCSSLRSRSACNLPSPHTDFHIFTTSCDFFGRGQVRAHARGTAYREAPTRAENRQEGGGGRARAKGQGAPEGESFGRSACMHWSALQ